MNLYSDFSNESLKQKYLVTKLHELNNKKNRSEDNYQNKNEIELPQKASDQGKTSEQMIVEVKDEVGQFASDENLASNDYSNKYIEYDEFFEENIVDNEKLENENLPFKDYPISFHSHSINKTD